MALILTVDEGAWRAHVDAVWSAHPGLVPVVKGTGYGFGRARLAGEAAARGAAYLAVGTVGELADLPPGPVPVVLTPSRRPAEAVGAVLTVARPDEVAVAAASGAAGVVVKLASSMQRYGATADELPAVMAAADVAGLAVVAYGLHFPLQPSAPVAEVRRWRLHLRGGVPIWCSHLSAEQEADLRADTPVAQRIGTRLWLGDKAFCHLGADVLAVRTVEAGNPCGYRGRPAPVDGHVVVVGAGTAQGLFAGADDRSPLHFARRRLTLVEAPHQHSTMAFVPAGEACPSVGELVDVQRPLTEVRPDEVVWR